jgi:hypothetical protein
LLVPPHVAGVLYWLGTGGPERRRHPYRNPAKDGKVTVVASHSVSSSTAHWMFVGRSNARAYIDCRHPGALKKQNHKTTVQQTILFHALRGLPDGQERGLPWICDTSRCARADTCCV